MEGGPAVAGGQRRGDRRLRRLRSHDDAPPRRCPRPGAARPWPPGPARTPSATPTAGGPVAPSAPVGGPGSAHRRRRGRRRPRPQGRPARRARRAPWSAAVGGRADRRGGAPRRWPATGDCPRRARPPPTSRATAAHTTPPRTRTRIASACTGRASTPPTIRSCSRAACVPALCSQARTVRSSRPTAATIAGIGPPWRSNVRTSVMVVTG